jgi:DNA-binding MarR family transcriptional regulator
METKRKNDYLKYWRVLRYFIKAKYGIGTAELDMLLFLYSEKYFGKDKFDEFNELISWNKNRFALLLRDGWIEVFRKREGSSKTLYTLSHKSRKMINSLYKKLNGEEIPVHPTRNPMFKRNVSYTDKVYRNMIKEMNAFIKQQRHQSPE